MRGKRSKQYRKLMEQFSMTFGFREPYQILVDAEMVKDSCRFKMDLVASLERTVHGKVKACKFLAPMLRRNFDPAADHSLFPLYSDYTMRDSETIRNEIGTWYSGGNRMRKVIRA
jgi:hypothetical protein